MRHGETGQGYTSASSAPRCPRCGKENFAFASFCIACGEPLEEGWGDLPFGDQLTTDSTKGREPGPERTERAASQARKLLKWESVAGVVLLICTVGYALFNWHQTSIQADAYHQGIAAEGRKDWDLALSSFQKAGDMLDASKHADKAHQNVVERDTLYNQAVAAASHQDWDTVLSSLAAVQNIEPGYKDSVERTKYASEEAFSSGLDGLVYLVSNGPAQGLYLRDGQGHTLRLPGSDRDSIVRAISPDETAFVYDRTSTESDYLGPTFKHNSAVPDPFGHDKTDRVPVVARLDPSGMLSTFPLPKLDPGGQGIFTGSGLWWFSAEPGKEIFGYETYYQPDYANPTENVIRVSDIQNGKQVVAVDPPRSHLIIAEMGENPASGNAETELYLTDASGKVMSLLRNVDGDVVQASVSDDGRRVLYISQMGSYPISRTVWAVSLEGGLESTQMPSPRALELLSWSGIDMNVRLSAAFLPQDGAPGNQLPRVIVDRVLSDTETLTVHDLEDLGTTIVWQGTPDGAYGRTMSGLAYDGEYLATRRQLGRSGQP